VSYALLDGLDGLTGAALRARLVEARAAALAAAGGDESHPLVGLVRNVEATVVGAMRAGVHALVHGMHPPAPTVPAPAPAPVPAPRPPVRPVPVPVPPTPTVPAPGPAPRPPGPGRLASLRRAPPADDGPPEAPERPPSARPPLPPGRPIHRLPSPPPLDPNDADIPY
jgi:hypothetical protein